MPEKKLVIDVEVKKKTTGSTGKVRDEDDPKVSAEREKQANKEKLENLKASLKQKQSLLDADIKRQQTLLDHAKQMQLEAERQGNKEKIKETIQYRKLMESQLRLMEGDVRLLNSKDLAEFKANLKAKETAQKQYDRSITNAPRTKLAGDIGSLAYTQQIARKQSGMLPGSQEYVQSGIHIDNYKAKLKAAGVDVDAFSTKIRTGVVGALSQASAAMVPYIAGMVSMAAVSKLWQLSLDDKKFEVLRANFKGTEQDLETLRIASARTVSEESLIKLSNQATDLGISLRNQAILFSIAEDQADKYGGTVEENFLGLVNSTEGATKVLKTLGIQKAVYNDIVKDLAKAEGDAIENLDPEIQKRIRIEALIKATNTTYEDAKNKQQDAADMQEELGVGLGDLIVKYGWATIKGILPFLGALEKGAGAMLYAKHHIGGIGDSLLKANGDIATFLWGWTGFVNQIEKPIVPQIDMSKVFTVLQSMPNALEKVDISEQWKKRPVNEGTRNKKSSNTGSKSQSVKDKEEELNLVKLQEKELAKLQLKLKANLNDYGAELDIKRKIRDVEEEIHRLRFGDPNTAITPKILGLSDKGPGEAVGISRRTGNNGRDAGIDEAKRIQDIYNQIDAQQIKAFSQSLSLAQQIDSVFGGGAADVINAFQTAYSITQSIVELMNTLNTISDLFSFVPGIGALSAIARADGGDVEKHRLYQWNENGRELFIPSGNGFILNAKEFSDFAGAMTSVAATQARNNTYVNQYEGKSGGNQNIVVPITLKNLVDFRKQFKVETVDNNIKMKILKG